MASETESVILIKNAVSGDEMTDGAVVTGAESEPSLEIGREKETERDVIDETEMTVMKGTKEEDLQIERGVRRGLRHRP